jgi:hypothetical protein
MSALYHFRFILCIALLKENSLTINFSIAIPFLWKTFWINQSNPNGIKKEHWLINIKIKAITTKCSFTYGWENKRLILKQKVMIFHIKKHKTTNRDMCRKRMFLMSMCLCCEVNPTLHGEATWDPSVLKINKIKNKKKMFTQYTH